MQRDVTKTLVLYAQYTDRLSYYDDWMDALTSAPYLDVRALNICSRGAADELRRLVQEVDLTILLHSTNGDTTIYLEPIASILRNRKGRLLSFIGNEVNLPGSPIAAKREVLAKIEPDFIATQLLLEAGEYLWGDLARRAVLALPHALNPDAFVAKTPQRERPIDIGVRAVRYAPHLGDDDRNKLHDFFAEHSFAANLKVDISSERFDRQGWAAFLDSCRATVSSEAGAWWLERDDATIEAIRAWTAGSYGRNKLVIANDSPLRKLGHKLPWWARSMARSLLSRGLLRHESTLVEDLPFQPVFERFFKDQPRPNYYGKCISSRHFDAIGTKTVQILLRGRYNDILTADTHYVALDPDFGNIDAVMEAFRDIDHCNRVAEAAHEHIMANHTYVRRVAELYDRVSIV